MNTTLRTKDDDIIKSPGQILYRDQINKVALTIREIIESLKSQESGNKIKQKEIFKLESEDKRESDVSATGENLVIERESDDLIRRDKTGKNQKFLIKIKSWILIAGILVTVALLTGMFFSAR